MEESGSNKNLIVAAVAVIVILAVAAGGFIFLQNKDGFFEQNETSEESTSNLNPTSVPTNQQSANTTPANYKDGTYTAEGDYMTHGGPEAISVTLTLSNNSIKDVSVKPEAKDQMSELMQGQFISAYKPMVIGKNIDSVTLSKVSGSSLTPLGFNDALTKIKTQAKS